MLLSIKFNASGEPLAESTTAALALERKSPET